MSLAHNGNSQLADSNTGETQGYLYKNGLSPFGREVIAEMNRLGMMIDLSHPSKGANMEAMRLSQAPVIASHSGVRALAGISPRLARRKRAELGLSILPTGRLRMSEIERLNRWVLVLLPFG